MTSYLSTALLFALFAQAFHFSLLPRQHPYETQLQKIHNQIPTTYPIHQLERRTRLVDLTLLQFDHATALSPITIAAGVLGHVYTQVSLGATGPWTNDKPRIWVRITYGSIQLLFFATEGYTVPWGFVSWHALHMLQHVRRGYVGTYDAYYMSPNGAGGIIVSLTCGATQALISAAAVAVAASEGSGGLNANAKPFVLS